jgi:hypothetical protein
MKRSLFALLALALLPSLAHAAAPAKTLKGQIAQDVRKIAAAKGLKFRASDIKTEALNGAVGGFSLTASKPQKGLPPKVYTIGGDWKGGKGPAKISDVKIELAPAQPL